MNKMKKSKFVLLCIAIEVMLILCIALANLKPITILYFTFYNLGYGLLFSILVPLYFLRKEKETLSSVGIKKLGVRQFVVLIVFATFSAGQLMPLITAGKQIPWNLLPMGIVPLIMTTFFEEFLFRGFIQARMEKHFGWLIAIVVSGLLFSLYHLGYPGYRNVGRLLLLFAVGVEFAIAYKLSGNNMVVSYFVNLPNAFITYIVRNSQFPTMRPISSVTAAVTIVLIAITIYGFQKQKVECVLDKK